MASCAALPSRRSRARRSFPAESGFPDFEAISWFGLLAPAGTPAAVEYQGGIKRRVAHIAEREAMKLPRRNFLHLAAGAAALPVVPSASAFGQGTIIPTNATMIVERTQYFAKPGLAAEVLDLRRKASAVRLSIGLPAGEIFVKHPGGDGSEPDVAWQCTFADVAARDADLAARAASAEFESVRVQMRKLYARFERQVFAIAAL